MRKGGARGGEKWKGVEVGKGKGRKFKGDVRVGRRNEEGLGGRWKIKDGEKRKVLRMGKRGKC